MKTGFSASKIRLAKLALGFGLVSFAASFTARAVSLTASDAANTSSFNSAGKWSDALAPASGKTYATGAFILRSPTTANASLTFAGDSLSIDAGGRLLGKTTTGNQTLSFSSLILNGGTLDQAGTNADTATLTISGAITVNSASFVGALGAAANNSANFETLDITATIGGSGALTVAGSTNSGVDTGVVKLSAANTYSGTITVATPTSGFVASATNRLLQLNHVDALRYATLNLTASVNGMSFAAAANTTTFRVAALQGTGPQNLSDTAGNPVVLNVGSNNATTSCSGVLTGAGALTKSGSGKLTLSGANAFTGQTTVEAGTLALSGAGGLSSQIVEISSGAALDVSAQSAPTLPSGQCLQGSGVVKGSLTAGGNSRIAPGSDGAVGILTFENNLALAVGSTVVMDVGASGVSGNDAILVQGALGMTNPSFRLRLLPGATSLETGGSYVLVTAASVSGSPVPVVTWEGTPPVNADEFRVVVEGTTVRLSSEPAPIHGEGAATPGSPSINQQVLLTVKVTPGTGPASTGIVVTGDLGSLGGSAAQIFYDDGTHGDVVAGDGLFSLLATVAGSATVGTAQLPVTIGDAQGRNATSSIFLTVAPAIANTYLSASSLPVTEFQVAGSVPLATRADTATTIYYSLQDAKVVGIAGKALRDDIERVTGKEPLVSTDAPVSGEYAIFVGTVGQSPLIDGLVSQGKIDVSAIQGKWEAYTTCVVENPVAGVGRALVIAGSDRRGTAYGVFGLSEAIGVSPWYWWGDVPVPHKQDLYVGGGTFTQASPGVKYRGIFINDEDWGFQPWAAKTFESEVGNVGPKTYATVFELLLRLHANVIWPAMHESPVETTPFYVNPQNKVVADDYAIVISTSHHEPMLRNSHEYDESVLGPYNYWTNRTNIYNFWDQRVAETAGYENIYTMGMRGRTDAGMLAPAGTTDAQKAQKIQNEIIPDQRQMIADHVNPDPSKVPQIFIPYKETLVQYQAGLQLPDDVTLVWPDDNHGYIRQLSTSQERARSGGSGVYYHLSYWGSPKSFLWLCTTPPAMTCSEMIKAWDYDARRIWLVNVGDIKPHEIGAEFFLRMARDPEAFRNFDQTSYLTQWAARNFGAIRAQEIAGVLEEYYRLNILVRPEQLNFSTSGFDFVGRGDEAQKRLDRFEALVSRADAIYSQLPAEMKPAFYEMVLFPIRGSYLQNKKVLTAERSRLWATQGRAATNALAAQATAANNAIRDEVGFYNGVNAGGKWNGMMTVTTTQEASPPYILPTLGSYSAPASAGLGVVVEGAASVLTAGVPGLLPTFNPVGGDGYYIDVFNTGTSPLSWVAQASEPWILLSQASGATDARIIVNIDWTKVPHGYAIPGTITIEGAGQTRTVNLKVFSPLSMNVPPSLADAVESNGTVVIEAEDYVASHDSAAGVGWRRQKGAAATGDAMTILPVTVVSLDPAAISDDTPSLSYQFYAFNSGSVVITASCLPTHKINSDHPGCRYAISLNGEPPQVVDVNADEYSAAWNVNVLRARADGVSYHVIESPGVQNIRIWMIDPAVVIDKLKIDISGKSFGAEGLAVETTTPYHVFSEADATGGTAFSLDSTAVGQSVVFTVPHLESGTFDLNIRVKKGPSRGIAQIAIGDSAAGPFTNLGSPQDLYNATLSYADLAPIRLTIASAGKKFLKFTVTGKNVSSSNYWIVLDHIEFLPVKTSAEPMTAWREIYFGSDNNEGDGADNADPDRDDIPNLLEYAIGNIPTVHDSPAWSSDILNDHLVLTFRRMKTASDVTYRVLAGNTLGEEMEEIWSSASNPYPGGAASSVTTTVTDPQEAKDFPSRFLRLEVSTP